MCTQMKYKYFTKGLCYFYSSLIFFVFIYCRYKSVVTKLIAYSSEYKNVFP
jgi:hypothetical protein